jgi:hypothetical protein
MKNDVQSQAKVTLQIHADFQCLTILLDTINGIFVQTLMSCRMAGKRHIYKAVLHIQFSSKKQDTVLLPETYLYQDHS